MPVTALDLALDTARPVQVSFDSGATLTLLYKPTAYSGDVERLFNLNLQMGREVAAHAYLLARLIESWDLEYGPDETVADVVAVPAGQASVTVEHGLGIKPKPSQVTLAVLGRELDTKEHLKKLNDVSFDIVFPDAAERGRIVSWEVSGLGGVAVAPSERYLARLPFPVLEHMTTEVLKDIFPNRRTFRR